MAIVEACKRLTDAAIAIAARDGVDAQSAEHRIISLAASLEALLPPLAEKAVPVFAHPLEEEPAELSIRPDETFMQPPSTPVFKDEPLAKSFAPAEPEE